MAKRQRIKVETMTYKLKDRQYNGLTTKNKGRNNDPQTQGQKIQWPNDIEQRQKIDNTMA